MKIISGAQTGTDRAALDAAIALGMDYGGSVPKGRKAEDGPISERYDKLTELTTTRYQVRTERNVVDADATLIFTIGAPTGGTAFTVTCAKKHRKLYLLVDLKGKDDMSIVHQIKNWLDKNRPKALNVAGPRESKEPGIYGRVFGLLKAVLDGSVN